jgi:uroporphyrinogen decarboxylase
MTQWSKRQRFESVMAGEPADRPPVSAWRHFIDREQAAAPLAEATSSFQREFDWDFVKINPRTTYYAEAWGNTYNYANYDGVVPVVSDYRIHRPEDVDGIEEAGADRPTLQEHVEVVRLVRGVLGGEVPILQTVFSPLAVLEYLAGNRTLASNRKAIREATPLPGLFAGNKDGVHRALGRISRTLAQYVQELVKAGADGIFYAALGLARDGYLTEAEYAEFGRPYDLQVLEALGGASAIIHTCGPHAHPDRFVYPGVQAVHWADLAPGNPGLADSAAWLGGKAAVGGVDEALFAAAGQEETIAAQARTAIRSMQGRPFILAPGCGVSIHSEAQNLHALRRAAEEAEN